MCTATDRHLLNITHYDLTNCQWSKHMHIFKTTKSLPHTHTYVHVPAYQPHSPTQATHALSAWIGHNSSLNSTKTLSSNKSQHNGSRIQDYPLVHHYMATITSLPDRCKATAAEKAMMFYAWISSIAALVYELCLSKVHYEKKEDKNGFLSQFFSRLPRDQRFSVDSSCPYNKTMCKWLWSWGARLHEYETTSFRRVVWVEYRHIKHSTKHTQTNTKTTLSEWVQWEAWVWG